MFYRESALAGWCVDYAIFMLSLRGRNSPFKWDSLSVEFFWSRLTTDDSDPLRVVSQSKRTVLCTVENGFSWKCSSLSALFLNVKLCFRMFPVKFFFNVCAWPVKKQNKNSCIQKHHLMSSSKCIAAVLLLTKVLKFVWIQKDEIFWLFFCSGHFLISNGCTLTFFFLFAKFWIFFPKYLCNFIVNVIEPSSNCRWCSRSV